MSIEQQIREIYSHTIPSRYEKMQKHMVKYKSGAIEKSTIKGGDHVVVFCCGTGMDFPALEERIGPTGRIDGVDFSKEMLCLAEKRINDSGWLNVNLVQKDVTFDDIALRNDYHAGVCTLGLSIIPDYTKAYENLTQCVKSGGQIIIGDMQKAPGVWGLFDPISIYLSRPFGGTKEGHENSLTLYNMMRKDLQDVRKEEFLFHSYFIAWGTKLCKS